MNASAEKSSPQLKTLTIKLILKVADVWLEVVALSHFDS